MSTASRRHALVIASQCGDMKPLARLGQAARSLHEVLLDSELGACEAGLPGSEALLYGELPAREIEAKVNEAIDYAAAEGATLVLAILGHGFIPGNNPTLYFMGGDSTEGTRDKAVDIPKLLIQAADRRGVRGVVGIIDTCSAAAAQPPAAELVTGNLEGQTGLALLMAAAATQAAYDLDLSRKLARLIRDGVPGIGARLFLTDLAPKLRILLPSQPPICFTYDGDSTGSLWLAHNQNADRGRSSVGSNGASELASALAELDPHRELPAGWDADGLDQLGREMGQITDSPEAMRVTRIVENLVVARKTVFFLRSFMPTELTTPRLRRALMAIGSSTGSPAVTPADVALASEVDAIEHVALRYPAADRSCRPQIARFVAELAGDAKLDLDSSELTGWAKSIGAIVPFNNAKTAWQQRRSERRLRLIVSLHYALADGWPEALGAWLRYDDESDLHIDIPCTADRLGIEKALVKAVDWAEEQAEALGMPLRRIEVAVPVKVLLQWRPEEVRYDPAPRLGVNYDVLTRWSKRMDPEPAMRRINNNAVRRLAEIDACMDGSRLHWLAARQISDMDRLREEFSSGRYAGAIGLIEDPGRNEQVFEVLLGFAPILLWSQTTKLSLRHRRLVGSSWSRLPGELLDAWRARWRAEGGGPMADLRAVWDDQDWLDFCRSLRIQPSAQSRSV